MMSLASRALALSFLFLLPLAALAQPVRRSFIEVLTVTVKPGSAGDYEAFVKRIVAGADKIGGPAR